MSGETKKCAMCKQTKGVAEFHKYSSKPFYNVENLHNIFKWIATVV
jgi:hypothetical protein